MSWNYRVIRHPEGHLAMHEVYYNDDGTVKAWTAEPVGFIGDGDDALNELIGSLEMALKDARERPILDRTGLEEQAAMASDTETHDPDVSKTSTILN